MKINETSTKSEVVKYTTWSTANLWVVPILEASLYPPRPESQSASRIEDNRLYVNKKHDSKKKL